MLEEIQALPARTPLECRASSLPQNDQNPFPFLNRTSVYYGNFKKNGPFKTHGAPVIAQPKGIHPKTARAFPGSGDPKRSVIRIPSRFAGTLGSLLRELPCTPESRRAFETATRELVPFERLDGAFKDLIATAAAAGKDAVRARIAVIWESVKRENPYSNMEVWPKFDSRDGRVDTQLAQKYFTTGFRAVTARDTGISPPALREANSHMLRVRYFVDTRLNRMVEGVFWISPETLNAPRPKAPAFVCDDVERIWSELAAICAHTKKRKGESGLVQFEIEAVLEATKASRSSGRPLAAARNEPRGEVAEVLRELLAKRGIHDADGWIRIEGATLFVLRHLEAELTQSARARPELVKSVGAACMLLSAKLAWEEELARVSSRDGARPSSRPPALVSAQSLIDDAIEDTHRHMLNNYFKVALAHESVPNQDALRRSIPRFSWAPMTWQNRGNCNSWTSFVLRLARTFDFRETSEASIKKASALGYGHRQPLHFLGVPQR